MKTINIDTQNHLRILFLEDNELDVRLVEAELYKASFSFSFHRVATAEEFRHALYAFVPDVILSNFHLPTWTGLEALRLLKERHLSIPFILVTDSVSEEVAVECMREGADDYVLKENIKRLPSALLNALKRTLADQEKESALKQLRASEERYRMHFMYAGDAIFVSDSQGRCLDVNREACRMTGYTREELLTMSVLDLLDGDKETIRQGHQRFLQTLRNRKDFRATGNGVRRKDGAILSYDVNAVYLSNDTVMSLARDVTEHKQSEEALRQSEEKYRDLVTRGPIGIYQSTLDGKFFTVNEKLLQILGYSSAAELFQCNILEDVYWSREDREKFFAESERTGYLSNREVQWKKKDGTPIWVELVVNTRKDRNGNKLYLEGFVNDISERKRAEEALRKSEDQYKLLFEHDMSGNYVFTPEGRIVRCNPAFARIYGFSSAEEAMKINAFELYSTVEEHDKFLQLLREKKKIEWYERECQRADGKPLHLMETIVGTFNDAGELVEILGYVFDITERKLLEDQLLQAQKMESIGTLVGGIAHDYNNILNNILGFIAQLKKYSHDQQRVLKYAETVEKSAMRGAELAGQLLSFVRKKERQDKPADLNEIVLDLTSLAAETFPKTVTFKHRVDINLMPVLGNQGELYQALLNLCLNAVDAINDRSENPGHGAIKIEVANKKIGKEVIAQAFGAKLAPGQDCVEITVVDDGVGIPEEIRTKIFDPFFTTKERGRGTGLGLSVVYNIIANHKGSFTLESEIGKGTTFRIYLPALVVKAPGQLQAGNGENQETDKGLILLVDDELPMQELGKELLEEQGYEVLIAGDGLEAVNIFRSRANEIDLVILDLVMPKLDGGQTYIEMKKINQNVRAFFCTGYTSNAVITSLLQEENLQALQKPFRPAEFLCLVNDMLEVPVENN